MIFCKRGEKFSPFFLIEVRPLKKKKKKKKKRKGKRLLTHRDLEGNTLSSLI